MYNIRSVMTCTMIVIICFLMTIFIEDTNARFSLSQFPHTAVIGENVSFMCAHDNTYTEIRINDKLVILIIGHENGNCEISGTYLKQFSYACNASTYTVSIPGSVMREDLHESMWECFNTLQQSDTSGKKELYINVPFTSVTLSSAPVDENPVKVIEGNNINFSCRTNVGRPSASIQWYISNENITLSATKKPDVCDSDCSDDKVVSSSTLTYMGNKNDNRKIIYCMAFNIKGYGVWSMNKSIDVLYAPTSLTITQQPPAPVKENETITLTCDITGGKPLANITWQCEGITPVDVTGISVNGDSSSSSVVLIATKEMNAKICICIGSHPAWAQNNSTSLELNITYAPTVPAITQEPPGHVIEGNIVVLTCEITGGNPLASITWMCDGLPLIKPTASLDTDKVISKIELNVSKDNNGQVCTCSGIHPSWKEGEKLSHSINVYFTPESTPSISENPNGSVDEGTEKTLTCEISGGNPLANITWQCDGFEPTTPTVSPPSDKSISSIKMVVTQKQNGKECTCSGFHPTWIQSKTSSIQLDVKFAPSIFRPITQTPMGAIVENSNVQLACEISGGNPLATIAWRCEGFVHFSTNDTLLADKAVSIISKNVSKDDNGKNCTCTGEHHLWATNKQESHTLNVYYSSTIMIVNKQPIFVVENQTMDLLCTEVDGNPRNASFSWYKSDHLKLSTSNYSISTVKSNDSGDYSCRGSNGFGRQSEAIVEVNVYYSPRIYALSALYGATIAENGKGILQCTVQSNPPPKMAWMKDGSEIILNSSSDIFQSNLTFENSSCFATSNYTCKAMNVINSKDFSTSKEIEYFVNCSPRLYNKFEGPKTPIGLAVGQNLEIVEHILAYPISNITWIFKPDTNSSETIVKSASDCGTNNIFDHYICFSKPNLTENEFGLYSAVVVNSIGNATFTYTVDPQGKPYKSTNVNVTCGILKAEVSWRTGYNGGQKQQFYIKAINKDGFQLIFRTGIVGYEKEVTKKYSLILPAGPFRFEVLGNNTFGNATVLGPSCIVQDTQEDQSVVGLAAGLGSTMAFVSIVIVAVIIFCRKRMSKTNGENGKLFKRSDKKTKENDDDELTDNPLYITSEIDQNGDNGPMYSTVDKTEKTRSVAKAGLQGPVYSEVKKTEQKGHSIGNIEMGLLPGNVYGNSKINRQDINDEYVYATAERKPDNRNDNGTTYLPKKNKDGLIYADLELDPTPSGHKFVIRGLENRTNYAFIDLNIKVDPLPSDDDTEENQDDAE